MVGMQRPHATAVVVALLVAAGAAATSCEPEEGPTISATLNAVAAPLNSLLVVPPSGFVVNVSFSPRDEPVDPSTLEVIAIPWDGSTPVDLTPSLSLGPTGAVGAVPTQQSLTAPNTYTLSLRIEDTAGDPGAGRFDFAVRDFPNGPPLGPFQLVWYDFEVDRDGDTQPDFPGDLAAVGLGSPADPALSAAVEEDVIDRLLDRVRQVYWQHDPNGLGADPVAIAFLESPPAFGSATRICVGGAAPGNPNLVGSILIDPGNANRASVECGNIPPTGIFPRGMLAYAGSYHFQQWFDPLMPARGGTPVGEHPLDAIILDPGFDPGSATPEELARFEDVDGAIQRYADALGTIIAHETGHALGLVEPGAPGLGLHGGASGEQFAHDLNPDGSVPSENYLMKAGPTVKFQHLAGLAGLPLPFLRPLDFAYLRDRAVVGVPVSALLPPPVVGSAAPATITASTWLNAYGSGFASPVRMRLVNESYGYELISESVLSSTHARGYVSFSQIPGGSFTLEVWNADGQLALGPAPIVVQK
jgi:hypothetical protein